MSVGPIPWTATMAWAERSGVRDEQRFVYLIEQLDEAWLRRDPEGDDGGADG